MKNYYVKIDGEMVDLMPGLSVTLERYNPIFDFDVIRGAKVLDYTLPFTAKNDRLFGWYRLHHSPYKVKKYYCEKYADGVLIEKGWVELLGTNGGYQIFFTQSLGEFFGDYQNTPLNLIDFGGGAILPKLDYDYTTDAVAWPMIKNTAFYADNQRVGFNGYVNEVVDGSFSTNCPMVPTVGLPYVFKKISALCGVTFAGEFFESDWYKRGLLDNIFSLDGLTEINYKNHLYDMSIPVFLKELAKLANCVMYVDSVKKTMTWRFREERMAQETMYNLTEKTAPNNVKQPDRIKRIELDWQIDSNDSLMKVLPADFVKYQSMGSDESFFKVKTMFSTRIKDAATGLAMAQQVGISNLFNQRGNNFTPKLLLWNGVINGKPTATNEHGDIRLAWHGSKNLANNWRTFEQFRSRTTPRTFAIRLNSADLARLNYHLTGGDNSIVHIAGRDFFVENIRVNLPVTNYATVRVWEK